MLTSPPKVHKWRTCNINDIAPLVVRFADREQAAQRSLAKIPPGNASPGSRLVHARQAPLLYFDNSACVRELLLNGLRFFLGDALFYVLRGSIHQFLGFF